VLPITTMAPAQQQSPKLCRCCCPPTTGA
jgi:hypothetical protein